MSFTFLSSSYGFFVSFACCFSWKYGCVSEGFFTMIGSHGEKKLLRVPANDQIIHSRIGNLYRRA